MLMEENAQLRAQLQGGSPYAGQQGLPGIPNAHGISPEEYSADEAAANALQKWQAEQAYMGNGMSDLKLRYPPRQSQALRKVPAPSPYLRKEGKRPSGQSVGLD